MADPLRAVVVFEAGHAGIGGAVAVAVFAVRVLLAAQASTSGVAHLVIRTVPRLEALHAASSGGVAAGAFVLAVGVLGALPAQPTRETARGRRAVVVFDVAGSHAGAPERVADLPRLAADLVTGAGLAAPRVRNAEAVGALVALGAQVLGQTARGAAQPSTDLDAAVGGPPTLCGVAADAAGPPAEGPTLSGVGAIFSVGTAQRCAAVALRWTAEAGETGLALQAVHVEGAGGAGSPTLPGARVAAATGAVSVGSTARGGVPLAPGPLVRLP